MACVRKEEPENSEVAISVVTTLEAIPDQARFEIRSASVASFISSF